MTYTRPKIYTEARERYENDAAEHGMSILKDDGLYRHIRFKKPGSMSYYYDLVTWPGHLVICGDMGDYHFARLTDMFEFFDDNRAGGEINPGYWSEKLQGPGHDTARSYSEECLRQHVMEWYQWQVREMPIVSQRARLKQALEQDVLGVAYSEYEAREALGNFTFEDIGGPTDWWEWDLRDYDFHFLWCCWAILLGIKRYRGEQ